jgi:hypothetical protein
MALLKPMEENEVKNSSHSPRTTSIRTAFISAVLMIAAAGCGKTPPQDPSRPGGQPTPKTSNALSLPPRSMPSSESGPEIMRLPAVPAESPSTQYWTAPKKPVRIWM